MTAKETSIEMTIESVAARNNLPRMAEMKPLMSISSSPMRKKKTKMPRP